MPYVENLIGRRFTRLLVLDRDDNDASGGTTWLCRCDCGKLRVVPRHSLVRGKTGSCGCLGIERRAAAVNRRGLKHGKSRDPLYLLWVSIINRCECPSSGPYKNYGGRGITVAAEWRHDFLSFERYVADVLGPKPTADHSLDRVDNDRGYEPGNLRWATRSEQQLNRRTSVKYRQREQRKDVL